MKDRDKRNDLTIHLMEKFEKLSQYIDRRMLFGMENAIDWALKNLEIEEE